MDVKKLKWLLLAGLYMFTGGRLPWDDACSPGTVAANPGFWDNSVDSVESLLAEMNDQELLGQVFMLGYMGRNMSADLSNWIERGIGGVKIFSRNVADLESLAGDIEQMQTLSLTGRLKIPLFIATDQEGGWVRHIKGETSTTPGNIAIGATGIPREALMTGYYIGSELKALGINMNFAPTIDIYSNPSANVIGPRAFSSNATETAMLALAYMQGMTRAGIICTAKHFPGHGHADKDSHGVLPVIDIDAQTLWQRELLPYRILIPEGLPAIMSGHLAFPEILDAPVPASLSSYFLKTILRDELNFEGVVITDDMEMNGVLSNGMDTAQASLEALRAGNDMILISHTPAVQEKTWRLLQERLRQDPIFREQIKESVRRILTLKKRSFQDDTGGVRMGPDTTDAGRIHAGRIHAGRIHAGTIPTDSAQIFFDESALRSATLLKGEDLPLDGNDRLLIIGQFEAFLAAGQARYPQADTYYFPYVPFYTPNEEQLREIPQKVQAYDTILFCLANYNSLEILKTLETSGKRIFVVSTLTPVYLREVPWVRNSVAVYGTNIACFKAGMAVLNGDYEPEGTLPIDFLSDP